MVNKLESWDLANKIVLVRADLNVPFQKGIILNDFRLRAIKPTIDLILKKGGKILLISHLGRPEGHDQSLSLKNLLPWFGEHGYSVDFAQTPQEAAQKSKSKEFQIILLENLRFFPGEKEKNKEFARSLAELADFFVNDAWGAMHRDTASMTLMPTFFEKEKRSIGLLVEQEMAALKKCLKPHHPYLMFLGGGKVHDKLPLLRDLLTTDLDEVVACPALVFTLLKARGHEVGISLVDASHLKLAADCIDFACQQQKTIKLTYPIDYLAEENGTLRTLLAEDFHAKAKGISLGEKTLKLLEPKILAAKVIVLNGLQGFWEQPETLEPFGTLLKFIAASDAYTIIAGGDAVGYAEKVGIAERINHCSTGGGATLSYIAFKELPGLKALE